MFQNFSKVALLAIALCFAMPAAAEPAVIGWLENIRIGDNFVVKAKIDTGADNSSLNTLDPEIYMKDGKEWIKFTSQNRDGETLSIDTPIVRWALIKKKTGGRQRRPVVELPICLGDLKRTIRVNLVDRSHFKYRMLIGRSFLKGNYIVDSAKEYTKDPVCL